MKLPIKEYRELWQTKGLCFDCGTCPVIPNQKRCMNCKENHKRLNLEYRERNKEILKARYEEHRQSVLRHYGMVCACCGEKQPRFLTLDHINNDGYLHRKEVKGSLYLWAEKNRFPNTLQVLCFNCNCAKAHNGGVCPHKQAMTDGIR